MAPPVLCFGPNSTARHHSQKSPGPTSRPTQKFTMRSCFPSGRTPSGVSNDHFLMFEYKIKTCPRRSAHDWIDCPYAHSGESARRREPHLYKPVPCPESKKGDPCPRGESCKYAHNDFEYWLHPSRFKTELCKQGPGCSRKVCFFAHQPGEIRKLSKSIMADQGGYGHTRNGRRSNAQSPVFASNEIASAMSRLMIQDNPEWGKVQRITELEESLQQLRARKGMIKENSMVHTGVNSYTNSAGFHSSEYCHNMMSSLRSMQNGPPVHLQGESNFSGYTQPAWPSLMPRDNRSESVHLPRYSSIGILDGDLNGSSPVAHRAPGRYSRKSAYLGSPVDGYRADCSPDLGGYRTGYSPDLSGYRPGCSPDLVGYRAGCSPDLGGYRAGCSPDLGVPVTGLIASGTCSSPLNVHDFCTNPYDNVAAQMQLAMEQSFPRPRNSGEYPLASPGQGAHAHNANNPDLWPFERTEPLMSPLHL